MIEAIKQRLPVWKQERYLDGDTSWLRGESEASRANNAYGRYVGTLYYDPAKLYEINPAAGYQVTYETLYHIPDGNEIGVIERSSEAEPRALVV